MTDITPYPGVFIRKELEARGWLQRDLAFVLNMDPGHLNKIISGQRNVSGEMAKKLNAALGVPAEHFLHLQIAHDLSIAHEPDPGIGRRLLEIVRLRSYGRKKKNDG